MTSNDSRGSAQLAPHTAAPSRVGQATAVEQSRAVAEVHAAIVVAQQVPRVITRAVADMQRSCAQKSLAERAFFRYSRAGSQISGPSVQLARELARCFGNMQYGITELRRDDDHGQSEMQAWCWDVQTNTRSSTTFIVPHLRDKRGGGPVRLTDMRDIYENNANMGARRLREMIFAILPGWYTEDAVAACYETLAGDDGGTLAERTEKAVGLFARLGVTVAQLEQKLGAPRSKWAPYDLAQLHVIYRSLMRGEARKEEEFGAAAERVTAADITGAPEAPETPPEPEAPAAGPPPEPPLPSEDDEGSDMASAGQAGIIVAHFSRLGYDDEDRDKRLAHTARLAGSGPIGSTRELTSDQARAVMDTLARCKDRKTLLTLLTAAEDDGGQP